MRAHERERARARLARARTFPIWKAHATLTLTLTLTVTLTLTLTLGAKIPYTIKVPTTLAHALYHRHFHVVDVHNHLRQGLVSMADVWLTTAWPDRHFAEGLGFWEVNVFRALKRWHPAHYDRGHGDFRCRLAHALLTLGKIAWGVEPTVPAAGEGGVTPCAGHGTFCYLKRFDRYKNEHHQCAFCENKGAYYYCAACYPTADGITFACCSTTRGTACFAKHIAGEQPIHSPLAEYSIKCSPRLTKKRTPETEEGGSSSGARPRRL